jgi:hypothetical protein
MPIYYYFEDAAGTVIPLTVVNLASAEWYCQLKQLPAPDPAAEEWTLTEMVPIGWLSNLAYCVRGGKETLDSIMARYSHKPLVVEMLAALKQRLNLTYIGAYFCR